MSDDNSRPAPARRDFLRTAGAAALTSNLFTGAVKGANDKINVAFIGVGTMGSGNLGYASKQPEVQVTATGRRDALAAPRAKNPAHRSSMCEKQRIRCSPTSESTIGAQRDPGDVHA